MAVNLGEADVGDLGGPLARQQHVACVRASERSGIDGAARRARARPSAFCPPICAASQPAPHARTALQVHVHDVHQVVEVVQPARHVQQNPLPAGRPPDRLAIIAAVERGEEVAPLAVLGGCMGGGGGGGQGGSARKPSPRRRPGARRPPDAHLHEQDARVLVRAHARERHHILVAQAEEQRHLLEKEALRGGARQLHNLGGKRLHTVDDDLRRVRARVPTIRKAGAGAPELEAHPCPRAHLLYHPCGSAAQLQGPAIRPLDEFEGAVLKAVVLPVWVAHLAQQPAREGTVGEWAGRVGGWG